MLASVTEQASLSLTWSETPEDMFSHDEAHIVFQTNSKRSIQKYTSTNLSVKCIDVNVQEFILALSERDWKMKKKSYF